MAVAVPGTLSTPVKLGWATGTAGTVTLLYLVNLFVLFFMTDMLGIDPASAGLILFAVRLYDMVTDPLVGLLSDRTATRWGRRRPWMLAGSVLSAVSCVMIFAPPDGVADSGLLTVYMMIALALYFTGYTAFNVPYLAMPAEMCPHYQDRTSLMSYRVFFVAVSGILATAVAPMLVEVFGGGMGGYRSMSWVMALLIGAGMLIAVISTAGARYTLRETARVDWRISIQTILQNQPLLILIGVKFLQLFALACSSASLLFFVKYILGRGESSAALYGLLMSAATILSLPLWLRMSRRAPKQTVLIIATVGQAVATLSWLLASADETVAVFGIRAVVLGMTSAGIILMGQSLLPDVIEYDYRRTGVRREGLLAAMYSFVEKTSFAFSPLVIGPFLGFMGYEANAAGDQADNLKLAFYISMAVFPAAAYLLSIPLLFRYHLTREDFERSGGKNV